MTADDFISEGLSLIEKGKRLIEYGEQLKGEQPIKKKISGHRTRAFIDAMKRDLILEMNERVLRQQKQTNNQTKREC